MCPLVMAIVWGWMVAGADPSFAQENDAFFDVISTPDGLPSAIVENVIQDGRGFVWIGTQGGLSRFDGVRHEIFPVDPRDPSLLADEFIRVVYEAPEGSGRVWVGTNSGGLHRYDPETDEFDRLGAVHADDAPLGINSIRDVREGGDGSIWAGTYGGGLIRIDENLESTIFSHPQEPEANFISALQFDRSRPEWLWCVTRAGLRLFHTEHGRFEARTAIGGLNALDAYEITSITSLPRDPRTIWVGTRGDGILEVHVESRRGDEVDLSLRRRHSSNDGLAGDRITMLEPDRARPDRIWVGTENAGLQTFDIHDGPGLTYAYHPSRGGSLSHNNVLDLFQDGNGLLWVGTWSGGLNRQRLPFRFTAVRHDPSDPNSPSSGNILFIYEAPSEPGVIWLATMNGGLTRWDRAANHFSHFFSESTDPLNTVSLVHEDATGQFWIGVRGDALFLMDRRSFDLERVALDPDRTTGYQMFIHESPLEPGILWIGTMQAGLYAFDVTTRRVVRHLRHDPEDANSLGSDELWTLYEDADGVFWIGTGGGGLTRYDRRTDEFTRFQHDPDDPETISSDRIVTVAQDHLGHFWLGTSDQGLNRFDPSTGRAVRYTREDGLPDTEVGGLVKDAGGMLWLATNNGLARLDPATEHITRFTEADGLHGPIYHYRARLLTQSGEVILGGPNGAFDIFHPDEVFINTEAPEVMVRRLLVDGEPHPLPDSNDGSKSLSLSYFENDLTFEFAALDFAQPFKNQYRVWLEGADDDWSGPTTDPSVRYANLAPGAYTFRVMASNNDGYWSTRDASVRLRIHAPFWQTWWFRLLLAGVALGLLAGAYQYRIAQMRRVERARQRIADDLHDDIGSKISNVALRLDLTQRILPIGDAERKQLLDLSQAARHVVDDLRDTVWIVDAGHDHLSNLVSRMEQTAGEMLEGRQHSFEQPENLPDVDLSMEQRRHIYLLFKEALHNAVRHSHATRVDVKIEYDRGTLTIFVVDDGIGFDEASVVAGRGLSTLRMRADRLGGELMLESSTGEGTSVGLRLEIR